MTEVQFIDTSLRDGQSSLWGYRMTTEMLLPVMARMDQAGFAAMEADSYNTIKLRVLQQKEHPWARIRLLAEKVTKTPLVILGGCTFGSFSEPAPLAVTELRARRLAANGIRRVQVIGFMNDLKFMVPDIVRYSHDAGLEVAIGLVYALSPRHTDEYYAEKTSEALKLKPDSIYLKDPIGLLTPERTKTIIPAILKNCGKTPLELHSHCTTGLAPLCYLEALKAGVSILHTGIPPLANGPAQPSVLNVARNASLLGYIPRLNEEAVRALGDHYRVIAGREGFPLGMPLEYDHAQFLHQIPGGVISNMKRQLTELGIGQRLPEVLEETARVRKDLGYPIMYTPFSQFIVTQATLNVVVGERYREVTDEIIKYILGYWGEESSFGVEEEVKARILDRARARELARQRPSEPTISEIRQNLGGAGVDEDELLMRYMLGGAERLKVLHSAREINSYPSTGTPLVWLIQEIVKKNKYRSGYIKVDKGDLSLSIGKSYP